MRKYHDTTKHTWPASQQCEHCDGANSPMVRYDARRGAVCPVCDGALDEMLSEGKVHA